MTTAFPVEPLAAAAGIELGRLGGQQGNDDRPHGLTALAELLGCSPKTAQRRRMTGLTEQQADQAATRIGLHPLAIWPTEWAEAMRYAHLPPAARRNAVKQHCPQGHPYTHRDGRGQRVCRYCHTEDVRKLRQKPANAQRVQHVTQPELWEAS